MDEITPCIHDGESIISLIEQLGYSEEDMLLCKLCQKEEIVRLTEELVQKDIQIEDLEEKLFQIMELADKALLSVPDTDT